MTALRRYVLLLTLVSLSGLGADLSLLAQGSSAPPTLDELQKSWDDEKATKSVRYRAALRIGSLKSSAAIKFLREKLEAEKDATLRGYLVRGLARAPQSEGVPALLLRLADDPSEPFAVRSAAISALRDLKIDWLGWYQSFLSRNAGADYHATIVRACARGGSEAAWTALEALDRQGPEALRAAVTQFASRYFPKERFFPRFVLPHLKRRGTSTLKTAALRTLGIAKDERFLEFMGRLRVDKTPPGTRAGWIRLCAGFNSPKALTRIRNLVGEGERPVLAPLYTAAFEMKDPEVRAWFRDKASKKTEPHWRRAAIESMRGTPDATNLKALLRLVRKGDDETAARAIQALGLQPREAAEEPLRELRADRDLHLAAEAMNAHYRLARGDQAVVAELAKIALLSRKWQLRVAAMETLMREHAVGMREALRQNASHDKAPVRSVAFEALTFLRERETVDFLIERLSKSDGRSQFEISKALTDLTDFHWGTNAERWQSWWSKVRDGYPLPPKKDAKKQKERGPSDPRYASKFYGLDIDSKRVVFIIDTSGSMTAQTGGATGSTRIAQAKRELASAIGGFKTDQRFQIIAFSTAPRIYGKRLVRATKRERKRAVAWVSGLNAGGGTNVYDSLQDALEIDGVDAIYLLSDGGPSAGAITNPDAIRAAIKRQNRFLRVNINTIGIGVQGQTANFLRDLAAENWGESIVLD